MRSLITLVTSVKARDPLDEKIVDVDTPYHHISVVDTKVNPRDMDLQALGLDDDLQTLDQHARLLCFENYRESGIFLSPEYKYRSVFGYTDYFHLAFLVKPKIERCSSSAPAVASAPGPFTCTTPR